MYFHEPALRTDGEFENEQEAVACLHGIVEKFPEVFVLKSEVTGFYTQPRCNTENKTPRIDAVLIPRKRLLDAGWTQGPIGIECKTSGKKIGPVIAQAQDYSRAMFELHPGRDVSLRWIFIWPLEDAKGDLASIMTQNRIGSCKSTFRNPLEFWVAGTCAIRVDGHGGVSAKHLAMGNKRGSR